MSINPKTLADQLRALADECEALTRQREADVTEMIKLRRQVSVLWDVAYEGLPRGDAFYCVVAERTGQTKEQAERYFLPDTKGEQR